jgi:hypothetical protein
MADKKITITKKYINNAVTPTTITAKDVESEVVNGVVVARQDVVNQGVISPA